MISALYEDSDEDDCKSCKMLPLWKPRLKYCNPFSGFNGIAWECRNPFAVASQTWHGFDQSRASNIYFGEAFFTGDVC